MLYYSNEVSIPVGFEIIKKDILYSDIKTKRKFGKAKQKRRKK